VNNNCTLTECALPDPKTIGQWLRFFRRQENTTLGDVAQYLGMSLVTLSNIERDLAHGTAEQLQALACLYGISKNQAWLNVSASHIYKLGKSELDRAREQLAMLYECYPDEYQAGIVADACDTLQLRASNNVWIDEELTEATRLVQAVLESLNLGRFESYAHRCAEAEAQLRCGWRPDWWPL